MSLTNSHKESLYMAQKQSLEIVRLSSPLLSATPVQSFLFFKLQPDNKLLALSTHASWLQSIYNNQSWLSAPLMQQAVANASHLNYFAQLWSQRQFFNYQPLLFGLNLWQRADDALYCWSFGVFDSNMTADNLVAVGEDLKIFANHFLKQAKDMIDDLQPFSMTVNTKYQWDISASKETFETFIQQTPIKYFPVIHNGQKQMITYKQALCLQGLCEGKSAKTLADEMGVSSRTIEKHIENLKCHLNMRHKNDMLLMYKASRDNWL